MGIMRIFAHTIAHFNFLHLIVGKAYRRDGVGSKLVEAVENAYKDKGYEK